MTLENDNPNPTGAVHQAGTRHGVDEGPVAAQAVLLHTRLHCLRRDGNVTACGLRGDVGVLLHAHLELAGLALLQNGVYTYVQLICSAHTPQCLSARLS